MAGAHPVEFSGEMPAFSRGRLSLLTVKVDGHLPVASHRIDGRLRWGHRRLKGSSFEEAVW